MKEYNDKRDFSKTKEPKGESGGPGNPVPVFVVQKHEATNLHYDFRLEIDGTLKSWSVPKGPSRDPSTKRMAIPTEDHPLTYADFEGTIPKDSYGGGTVMIWDQGTIESNRQDEEGNLVSLEDSYRAGSIAVVLHGKKLRGGYNLVEMKGGRMKGNWLLMKQEDSEANAEKDLLEPEAKSAATGRTMEEIAGEES